MKGKTIMVKIVTSNNIDDMLRNPSAHVDETQDIVLLEVIGKDATNPVMLMIGKEENDANAPRCYYFVEEDNEVSIYHHCSAAELQDTYAMLLERLVKEAGI